MGAKSGGWSEHTDIPASFCVEYGYDVLLCASVSYDHQPSKYVTRQGRTEAITMFQQRSSETQG